jgi:hypothetical protein
MNFDIARFDLAKVATPFIVTPLTFEFHGTSPPTGSDDTPTTFSRLRYPLREFHG